VNNKTNIHKIFELSKYREFRQISGMGHSLVFFHFSYCPRNPLAIISVKASGFTNPFSSTSLNKSSSVLQFSKVLEKDGLRGKGKTPTGVYITFATAFIFKNIY